VVVVLVLLLLLLDGYMIEEGREEEKE